LRLSGSKSAVKHANPTTMVGKIFRTGEFLELVSLMCNPWPDCPTD
jgi:hypothetical protein